MSSAGNTYFLEKDIRIGFFFTEFKIDTFVLRIAKKIILVENMIYLYLLWIYLQNIVMSFAE